MSGHERQHAAIVFTDICGYTALMGKDEDRAFEILTRNHTIHETLIKKYNGTLIKEVGDGTLASFPLASDAVSCAMDIQEEARSLKILLKIGIRKGEMVFAGVEVLRDEARVGSSLESIADPVGNYISKSIEKAIRGQTNIQAKYIGKII